MRYINKIVVVSVCMVVLAGCMFSKAPKPPEGKGEYRPINVEAQKGASLDGTGKIVRCEDRGQHGQHG